MWLIALIWVVNFGISWFNAVCVGKAWVESKHYGGWPYFMAWMGGIMAACGFTWCFTLFVVLGLWQFEYLDQRASLVAIQLGYLLVIPGILFSGLMITIDSWARAYRERTLANIGAAGWNTFADIYNTYHAFDGMGEAISSVVDFFTSGSKSSSSDDDDNKGAAAMLVLLVVVLCAIAGILLTIAIVRANAGTYELERRYA